MTKHLLAAALVFFTTPVAADVPTASIQVNASGPDESELQDMQRQQNWQVQYVGPSATLFATLSNLHVTSPKVIEGDVAFQNEASNNTNVYIGDTFGNAPAVFYPLFVLVARNAAGQLYKLFVSGPNMPVNCGGLCGEEILSLTPHVAHTVHQKWQLAGRPVHADGHTDYSTLSSPLPAGPYEFYVDFEGVTSECASDAFATAGQLLSCWIGKLQSNRVTLTVPEF